LSFPFFHRPGFACQHGFVETRSALDDDAIDGHLVPRPDQYTVAGSQVADGHLVDGIVRAQAVGRRRQQADQRLQRPGGAHDRLHLDPVAEQHDVDQGDQLPEEHLAGQAKDHGAGVEEGDGDGQGNEGHHARAALGKLADKSLEEGPTAIEEYS
jgi:hypothetical protein